MSIFEEYGAFKVDPKKCCIQTQLYIHVLWYKDKIP